MPDMVDAPLGVVKDLADYHKKMARAQYEVNRTAMANLHQSWARRLADAAGLEWEEIAPKAEESDA